MLVPPVSSGSISVDSRLAEPRSLWRHRPSCPPLLFRSPPHISALGLAPRGFQLGCCCLSRHLLQFLCVLFLFIRFSFPHSPLPLPWAAAAAAPPAACSQTPASSWSTSVGARLAEPQFSWRHHPICPLLLCRGPPRINALGLASRGSQFDCC